MTSPPETTSTTPKPFIFVLMPFDDTFADIYKFGIKGAADDIGAYAERVDEQIFTEGILDRIYNQVSKADVIVADMTGRNPNVFYEVGYAHALGKIVILLTQRADDIPFDLKHRQHTLYAGKIEFLRQELAPKLVWAIAEARKKAQSKASDRFSIRMEGIEIPPVGLVDEPPLITGKAGEYFSVTLQLRNDSLDVSAAITHVYLFGSRSSAVVPCEYQASSVWDFGTSTWAMGESVTHQAVPVPLPTFAANAADGADGLGDQYRLKIAFPALPPSAVEGGSVTFMFRQPAREGEDTFRLRLLSPSGHHDYKFRMRIALQLPDPGQVAKE